WVHDYQLQLVPLMVRRLRPDVSIGFFNHIPFPPYELFAQLPWRVEFLRGLLGADLVGFQRPADAAHFRRAVGRWLGFDPEGLTVSVPAGKTLPPHVVRAAASLMSTDSAYRERLAEDPDIIERAWQIREDVGLPKSVMLGVDRIDYPRGIRH